MIRPTRTHRPTKTAPLWMSVDAAVPYLGINRDAIYRSIKTGKCTVRWHRFGRSIRLSIADVMALAAKAT